MPGSDYPWTARSAVFTSDEGATFTTGQSATNTVLRRCIDARDLISANCWCSAWWQLPVRAWKLLTLISHLYKRQNSCYIPSSSGSAQSLGVDGNGEILSLSRFAGIEVRFQSQNGCWNGSKIWGWRKWKSVCIRSNPMMARVWSDFLQTIIRKICKEMSQWT